MYLWQRTDWPHWRYDLNEAQCQKGTHPAKIIR